MLNFLRRKSKNAKLFYDTEVHCHILPGVDHGASDVENSLEMIKALIDLGISRFICTSHTTAETFENTPETLTQAYDVLCEAVKAEGLDIELFASSEYRIDEYWDKMYAASTLLPMPGNYILMENSFQQELLQLDDLLFELMIKGYKPILAHPERYGYYSNRRHRYEKMHGQGVKFQLNILSLAGFFGPMARDNAMWLIKHEMVDMIGSDLHNVEQAHIIKDYIRSKDWSKISKKLEPHIINHLVK